MGKLLVVGQVAGSVGNQVDLVSQKRGQSDEVGLLGEVHVRRTRCAYRPDVVVGDVDIRNVYRALSPTDGCIGSWLPLAESR